MRTTGTDVGDATAEQGVAGDERLSRHWHRLRWLAGRAPAPTPVAFVRSGTADVLVSRRPPGTRGDDPEQRVDIVRTVAELARLLGAIHATTVGDGPRLDIAGRAAAAVGALRSDPSAPVTDPAYARTPRRELAESLASGIADHGRGGGTLVVGRPTLDNLTVDAGRATGFLDWADAGLGDAHLDLVIAARSVAALSPQLVPELVRHYPGAAPDLRRLDWYQLFTGVGA